MDMLKLVLQNASGRTHTTEHETQERKVHTHTHSECNLISPDSLSLLVYSITYELLLCDGTQLD